VRDGLAAQGDVILVVQRDTHAHVASSASMVLMSFRCGTLPNCIGSAVSRLV